MKRIGWIFVAVQAVLLAAIVFLPGRSDWTVPDWLEVIALLMILVGVAGVAVAALGLGPALTANPVPTERAELVTTGLYGLVRHPIYSGVLAAVIGVAIRSGSLVVAALAVATVGFFHVKASWEEERLAERFENYTEYAQRTPRFLPRPWRLMSR